MGEAAKVLLIDDERSLRRNLSVGLMQRGYEMIPCPDGFSALNTLKMHVNRQIPIKYAVTDIMLPDIDGLKLLKVMKSQYPELPVFVISGFGDESTREVVSKELGAGFLEKPFTADELVDLLEEVKSPPAPTKEKKLAAPGTETQQQASSAYVFVTIDDRSDFADVYRRLYFMDRVLYCDAAMGDCHLILLVQSSSQAEIRRWVESELMTEEGVLTAETVEVIDPMISESTQNVIRTVEGALEKGKSLNEKARNLGKSLTSYMMLEIEPEYFEDIYKRLYFMEGVVYCDATAGRYGLVSLIQAPTFDLINKRVMEIGRNIDGILKVKQHQIMNLFEM